MNLPQVPIQYLGATAIIIILLLIILRRCRKPVDTSPAGKTAQKLRVALPEYLQSIYQVNAFRNKMNISASAEDTFMCYSGLLTMAVLEAGKEDKIRLSQAAVKRISQALAAQLVDIWAGYNKKPVDTNMCLSKIANYENQLSQAFQGGQMNPDESNFEREKPHYYAARAMSMALLGSLRLDFIKHCETTLSGRIILIRDIIGAAQACYDFQ